jgi:hypothetical protein
MIRFLVFMTILSMVSLCFALPSGELPFGAFYLKNVTEGGIDTLRELMGFNIVEQACLPGPDDVIPWGNRGIAVIKGGYNDPNLCDPDTTQGEWIYEPIGKYSHYNYAFIQAEERVSQMRMYDCGGTTTNDYWISARGDSVSILFGPDGFEIPCYQGQKYYVKFERFHPWTAQPYQDTIEYNIEIRMKIDAIDSPPNDIVCYLVLDYHLYQWPSTSQDTIAVLQAEDFPGSEMFDVFNIQFSLPDTVIVHQGNSLDTLTGKYSVAVALLICPTGKRELTVDWMKVYDLTGRNLIERAEYDDEIEALAGLFSQLGEDTLWGWYVRDEPLALNIQPSGYVLDVAQDSGDVDWQAFACVNDFHRNYYWFEKIDTDVLGYDYYPFLREKGTDRVTTYAGFNYGNEYDGYTFQSSLHNMARVYVMCKQAANANEGQFWAIPQAFEGQDYNAWRKPTVSEFLCETFMALACGAEGIVYWKYDGSAYWKDTMYCYYNAIRDSCVNPDEGDLWYAIKDRINPYLKAIGETYLGLTWRNADYVSLTHAPALDIVNTVNGFVNDPDSSSPDIGWFHVGEYEDSSGEKYFMLVNRACSRDSLNPIEAGSITAIVEINRGEFDDAERLFVIDIAHEVADTGSGHYAIPETTYTTLYGSKLYFTTILKAGEGRLFKVASYNDKTNNILTANNNELY